MRHVQVALARDTLGLDVIYGDTDSIMVHTNTDDLAEVRRWRRMESLSSRALIASLDACVLGASDR